MVLDHTVPNTVIAGAPKCGTTTVFNWLRDHPEVGGSSVKETFYCMDEESPLLDPAFNYHTHGLKGYRSFFTGCPPGCRVVVEATSHYLYQQTALEVLAGLDPPPKVIFVLRKPSARVWSSYQFTRNVLVQMGLTVSFSRLIEQIRAGESLEHLCHPVAAHVLRNDLKYSCYVDYLDQWRLRLPADRLHLFLLEEIDSDPRRFSEELARLVGIDPTFYRTYDFPAANRTYHLKNLSLHRLSRRLGSLIPRSSLRSAIKRLYFSMQSGRAEMTSADRQALDALDLFFDPFNQRLADTFDIDLSCWDFSVNGE